MWSLYRLYRPDLNQAVQESDYLSPQINWLISKLHFFKKGDF